MLFYLEGSIGNLWCVNGCPPSGETRSLGGVTPGSRIGFDGFFGSYSTRWGATGCIEGG